MINHPDENHDTAEEYLAGRPAEDEDETGVPLDVAAMVGASPKEKRGEAMQEYDVCIGNDITELLEKVNFKLRDGWQCQGGVYVLRYEFEGRKGDDESWWFYQAVVKNRE